MVNGLASFDPAQGRSQAINATWRRAAVDLALVLAGVFLLFHDAAISMASIWLTSSVYHHGVIVAPLTAWLIYRRRDWRDTAPQRDIIGAVVVAVAALIWLTGRAASLAVLGHAAIALSIIGAVIAVFGRGLARRWAFPLGFVFFMVPFGAEATPTLQHWAAVAVSGALNLSGLETTRDGFMLTTRVGRFEMAEACAGLRFLLAATMIAYAVAALAFTGWKKRVQFLAAALIAAVLANWVRAYLIILAATLSGRRIGLGPEHVALGWIFYSALILGLVALARRLADTPGDNKAPAPIAFARSHQHASFVALAGCALIATYDLSVVSAVKDLRAAPSVLPLRSSGFIAGVDDGAWAAHAPHTDGQSTIRYHSPTGEITVSASYVAYDRAGAEIASGDNRAADGVVWRRLAVSRRMFSVDGRAMPANVETLENDLGHKLEVATIYWLGDKFYGSPLRLKLVVAANKLLGKNLPGGAYYVAADTGPNALDLINDFLASAEPIDARRAQTGVGP